MDGVVKVYVRFKLWVSRRQLCVQRCRNTRLQRNSLIERKARSIGAFPRTESVIQMNCPVLLVGPLESQFPVVRRSAFFEHIDFATGPAELRHQLGGDCTSLFVQIPVVGKSERGAPAMGFDFQ